ncbi:hypothetical protein [Epilithonimonas hominis]|uniref:CD-NTase-associated protein 12/Pycsar effector protein TIR domain-containing protein n=1 Tax=Epilithonimonas hominis TaxID=420404 RepID=A0A3N0X3N2_9FLAO|nr:hypothetical protein [Epilithonimonas hominis]ROI11997.1 hypothetical protein EGH73_12815 [Epilithonimonas hominis]
MKKFNIFYSWQSDLNLRLNNYYIKDCIVKALKELKQDFKLELRLDRDTKNTTGSPDIVQTIFDKIDICNIFIADVSIVNKNIFNIGRKTPNPNVLVELGYALKTLGKERVILIINNSFCKIDDLPFDIRQNRITQYTLSKTKEIKHSNNLKDTLKKALKDIILNYESIEKQINKNENRQHDLKIFENFKNEFDEVLLKEILEFIPTNLRTNQYYYNYLDKIANFADNSDNKYIDEDLNIKFKEFIKSINAMNSLCAITMIFDEYPGTRYEEESPDAAESEIIAIQRSQRYLVSKECYDDDWTAFNQNRNKIQQELNDASDLIYRTFDSFRMEIKRKLFI